MTSEDVEMEDAANDAAAEHGSKSKGNGTQPQAEEGKDQDSEEEGADSGNQSVANTAAAGSSGGASGGGATAAASAKTPASAAGTGAAADIAGTSTAAGPTGGTSHRKAPVERPTREDPAAVEKLRAYVASLGGTLPQGWTGLYKMRMGGSTAGQYDLLYRNPEGRVFRSRADVLRALGLDLSGGAGASANDATTKKSSAAKGSKKKAAGAQPAEDGTKPEAAATAVPPSVLPRDVAAKSAKERAAALGLKVPFATERGVTVLSLGVFKKTTGFYDSNHIWPLGYRAAWVQPPHDPAGGATAAKKSSKKKTVRDATPASAGKEGTEAMAATEPAVNGKEDQPKVDVEAVAAATPGKGPTVAPSPPFRFVSEIRKDSGDAGGPSFVVLLEPNPDAPSTADSGDDASAEPLLVHAAAAPDAVWSAVVDLQATAGALCKRAEPSGAGPQPTAVQRALAAMPPVGKTWGMDCFGLSDLRVLQLLEALPGVDTCEEYSYVEQRNSWDVEAASIANKRNAILSGASNGRAAAAATKQRKRQQQLSINAFVDRPPPPPKADMSEPAALEGHEDLATAAAVATSEGGPAAAGTAKKSTAKSKVEGKAGGGGKMTREDFEIRSVLDRLVERVSMMMAEPDEKERHKLLKAMQKADRAAARRREKTAEKAAEKAAADGTAPSAAAPGMETQDKGKKDKEKQDSEKEKEKKLPKAPKVKAAKDKDAAVAADGAAKGAVEAQDAAAAPASLPQQTGNQLDERALSTADEPAPPGMPLELFYPVTASGPTDVAAADGGAGSAPGAPLGTVEVQQLLTVYQFMWDHRKLLGLEGRVPSLADLLAVVSEPPARLPAPTRRAADEVHLALVRLLVGEALNELLEYIADTSNLNRRDLSPATPPITAFTWPELARRYLAAAAAARYLATSEPRSSALSPLQLPGQLQNLEPADWLHYLLAGLNFPHLLSRIALLPHASSRWAADALLSVDDARARAAAERALQGIKSFDLQHLDGEGQVRRGRRLLHALLTLPEDGNQLGFYAPEFSEVLRAPRGLDLHTVAARLDAGLYQSTCDWLQAVATDVRSALWLWRTALSKHKDIPGHQDARAGLADDAERKLAELLADPDTALALPALPAPADAAAEPKPDADTDMQDADGSGGKGVGKAGKARKSRGTQRRKQQAEDGSQATAEEDEGDKDPASLDDPTRLFNPRDGCRVCWLDMDKTRLLLCDGCDGEYHCYCVEPPLLEVPDGAWFCPSCTARGLGLPKADDESEDTMEVDAAADRRGTPHAATPSRNAAAAAAAGGASISPSDGSASGRTPCSPAFQHCHSHSHLVSELHDRAAARRVKPRSNPLAPAPAPPASRPGGSGRDAAEAGLGEAPLSIPADVPEGPRVTLRTNSRPGLQELAGLLRLAHLLGNYDYSTGGPVGGSSADTGAGGWTPARRLALLFALCELAMDTNALRSSLDDIVETRKKSRVEANAIRSKARQIQEEQLAAKKAATEKENAPKPDSTMDVNAGAGAATAEAGRGGKGGKAGAKDSGKDAKPKGGKAHKAGKMDKDAETAGKEGADEEGATQEAKDVKEGGETTAAKASRNRRPTDLSVLPEAELKRLMSLEAQVEGLAVRQEALGEDRHGSRYWWLGADHINPQGPQGVILVELIPPGHTATEQAKAFNERQAARQREEQEERARKAQLAVKKPACDGEAGAEQEEVELDEWGLPKERPRPRTVAIGVDAAPGQSYAVFHTVEQLNSLITWLNPKGIREGPLRTALLRARDRIVSPHAAAAVGDKQKQSAATAQAAPRREPQEEIAAAAADEGNGKQSLPPPPQMLCPAVNLEKNGGRRGGGVARLGSAVLPEANGAEGCSSAEPAEALSLRAELLSLYRGLPSEAFSRFWGSALRQKRWCEFVEGATTPQQLCAALTVLEAMLVDEAFRPHWRLYCMPAQHPELCTTWSAAWYRLGGLQSAIRKQIITQRELHHPATVETVPAPGAGAKAGKGAAAKKEKAAAAGKQQPQQAVVQQERYPSRRGGSAAPALPDISNVRSREAVALLGKAHKDAAGKGQRETRGQKRQRNVAADDDDDEEEDDEEAENAVADRKRGKRAATAAAKDRSRRPAPSNKAQGKAQEQSEEGEVASEEEEDQDFKEEEEEGSDRDAEASGLEDEDDEEEDDNASDEEGGGRIKKRGGAPPSRASARLRNQNDTSRPRTRRSSRLKKVESELEDEDLSSSDGEEHDDDMPPTKRAKAAPVAAAAGRAKTRSRAALQSDGEDDGEGDDERRAAPAKGTQGRTRGGSTTAATQANGTRPGMGSRAAAILANRKRALADWSEESDSEDEDRRSAGSKETSSSGEDPPPAAAGKKRGGSAASQAAPIAVGKRGVGRQQLQQQPATRKPQSRRMARSEVEYDVEDFDDLNT